MYFFFFNHAIPWISRNYSSYSWKLVLFVQTWSLLTFHFFPMKTIGQGFRTPGPLVQDEYTDQLHLEMNLLCVAYGKSRNAPKSFLYNGFCNFYHYIALKNWHQEEFYRNPEPTSVTQLLSCCLRECLKHRNCMTELASQQILPYTIFCCFSE